MRKIFFRNLVRILTLLRFRINPKNVVFIIGTGRSGTTLLADLLKNHPELAVYPNEANDLWHPSKYPYNSNAKFKKPFWMDPIGFSKDSLKSYDLDHKLTLINTFGLFQIISGKKNIVIKSAMITFMMKDIIEMFPGSKVIFMLRDGRSVALSFAKKQALKMKASPNYKDLQSVDSNDLIKAMVNMWNQSISELDAINNLIARELLLVKYEDLCEDPVNQINRISDHLMIKKFSVLSKTVENQNKKPQKVDSSILNLMNNEMNENLDRFKY